jgi:hypothetical protein
MRALLVTLAFVTLATGCIAGESGEPPVVGIRNMYNQPRYDTQERQPFFADQRSMRPQVEGTVSREMSSSLTWATGRAADEGYLLEVPAKLIASHGAALGASGLIAPSFHDDRLRHIPDGQLFATITNGVRNMPSYAHNIPVDDRWAIVHYVRALQLSQAPVAAPENTEQSQ